MNLILEKSRYVRFYTDLSPLFSAIPDLMEYTYFVSDLEHNGCEDPRFQNSDFAISGTDLYEIVKEKEIQFIWGVFSAFKFSLNITEPFPSADGNPSFWQGIPKPQAKGAEFEIVCWDSSYTLFIGVSEEIANSLKTLYPDIKNLDQENLLNN
ncbi:hypothetical protein [Leptospira neocaledonica]|uniref:Uncharacterized protein n=1 Tax=Leptospira neocaledonica TaxID=2023192 RepID=A0A2M9ZWB1_9LEPT|nr:hypothetical protein [Leptospira neocaledonica]PJZ76315.1 hypothetical protein CH365_13045 [Leptospira neocaledonica]